MKASAPFWSTSIPIGKSSPRVCEESQSVSEREQLVLFPCLRMLPQGKWQVCLVSLLPT